jgi:hypothetical protein
MDDALRNPLWNFMLTCVEMKQRESHGSGSTWVWEPMINLIARDFFKVEVDTVPLWDFDRAKEWLRKQYKPAIWWRVYNVIEFLVQRMGAAEWFPVGSKEIAIHVNKILIEEFSGYRFVSGKLVPISNATEVRAIEEAIEVAKRNGYVWYKSTGSGLRVGCGLIHDSSPA